MRQGDVLLLDNILMAHGRRRFQGRRRILVALIKNSW
ncbi:TauD/TfdA family dioxygenase [Cylindrospermum stagnale]